MQIAATSMLIATTFASFSAAFHCEPGKPGHPSKDGSAPDVVSRDAGADATPCSTLVVEDPAISLDGYTRFAPDQKRNNPNAGDPSYVYLAAGSEAVVIPGPEVASAPGLFVLKNPSIAVGRRLRSTESTTSAKPHANASAMNENATRSATRQGRKLSSGPKTSDTSRLDAGHWSHWRNTLASVPWRTLAMSSETVAVYGPSGRSCGKAKLIGKRCICPL